MSNFVLNLSCFHTALQLITLKCSVLLQKSLAQFTPTYSPQRHNLPRTRAKLCHKTTFSPKAIFLKPFISDQKLLFSGMHHIMKYMYILKLKALRSWPHFKVTLSKNWHNSPHFPLLTSQRDDLRRRWIGSLKQYFEPNCEKELIRRNESGFTSLTEITHTHTQKKLGFVTSQHGRSIYFAKSV